MSLLAIVITLIVIGVLLWLMETYLPLDQTIKRIIQGLVIIVTVVWLLQVFGLLGSLNQVRIN